MAANAYYVTYTSVHITASKRDKPQIIRQWVDMFAQLPVGFQIDLGDTVRPAIDKAECLSDSELVTR